jgi:O-antigen/teichoic acid export membrane protein
VIAGPEIAATTPAAPSRQRVARNTAVQLGGTIVAKLLTFAFYILLARHFGEARFGDFVFSLSLALLVTSVSSLGTDPILTREVSRRPAATRDLFWSCLTVKMTLGAAAVAVAAAVGIVGGYSRSVEVAITLFAVTAVLDSVAKTVAAVFLAHDDLWPATLGQLFERGFVALAGIALVGAGAGLVDVAAIYVAGASVGVAYMARALRRLGVDTGPVRVPRARLRWLVATSLPLGVGVLFSAILFRVDATILSFIKGNTAVGIYGVATQLLESTLFISFAVVTAMVSTLARLGRDTRPSLGSAYEGALKVIVLSLLPIGTGFVVFARPVVHLLYAGSFSNAVMPMRLIGGAAALYGVSYLSVYLLITQGRTTLVGWVAAAVALENVALNLVLIPRYSFDGAAVTTSISEATNAILLVGFCLRETGGISAVRVALGPAVGCLGIAAVAAVFGASLASLTAAAVVYLLLVAATERLRHPDDLQVALELLQRRRRVT